MKYSNGKLGVLPFQSWPRYFDINYTPGDHGLRQQDNISWPHCKSAQEHVRDKVLADPSLNEHLQDVMA